MKTKSKKYTIYFYRASWINETDSLAEARRIAQRKYHSIKLRTEEIEKADKIDIVVGKKGKVVASYPATEENVYPETEED